MASMPQVIIKHVSHCCVTAQRDASGCPYVEQTVTRFIDTRRDLGLKETAALKTTKNFFIHLIFPQNFHGKQYYKYIVI